jgi:hypothetical protein
MKKTLDGSAVTTVTCAYRSELVFKCQRHDNEMAQSNDGDLDQRGRQAGFELGKCGPQAV